MMQVTARPSRGSVVLSMLLCVPAAAMLALLMLGIEPPLGPLAPLLATPATGPNVAGTAVALTVIVLLPALALGLNARPLFTGAPSTPARLLVAAVPLCVIAAFVMAVVADQYPCWMGVPNCD